MDSNSKRSDVAIVGLGYVGLNLARVFSNHGHTVLGIDIDSTKISTLNSGRSPISELTHDDVSGMLSNWFQVSSRYDSVAEASAVIVTLPTPVTRDHTPNLAPLLGGVDSLAPHLRDRTLVVVESTVAPGTVTNDVLPVIEKHGKKLGQDFLLAFSPERVDPGGKNGKPEEVPKIVSGVDDESLRAVTDLYASIGLNLVQARSVIDAESAKLLENTYRAVNIALVNELAPGLMKTGADISEVVRLASTKPFGFQAFYPGPGVGGHCIPIDPWYLEKAILEVGGSANLTKLSMFINKDMPRHVAKRISDIINSRVAVKSIDKPVLLLGMSYKADVDDFRESPGPELAQHLADQQLRVGYHDPYLSEPLRELRDLTWEQDLHDAPSRYGVCVVLQEHGEYTPVLEEWKRTDLLVINVGGPQRNGVPSIWDPRI